jgi:hypothetical protein
MHTRSIVGIGCGAAMLLFALAAHAVSCNIVVDGTGMVVYQDVAPPVDMSERGAAARERMRQRGEQLIIIEAQVCPRLVFSTIANSASVDEIVASMRPYVGVTGGMGSSARPGASGTIAGAPAVPSTSTATRTSASGRPY